MIARLSQPVCLIESTPVVGDPKRDRVPGEGDFEVQATRTAMTNGVGDRLLSDAKQLIFDVRMLAADQSGCRPRQAYPRVADCVLCKLAERGDEILGLEHR